MRCSLTKGLVSLLLLTTWVLAGCGGEATEAVETGMQASTTLMQESTITTETSTASAPVATETTQDGSGGMEVPEAVPGSYTDLTPEQAEHLIETAPDLVVIDVSPNYDKGHLPGAVNYYIGDGSLEAAIPALDKEVPYLVYCHVDSVAIAGAQALVDAGFSTVYRLQGNYSAWVDAGYPVEK